MAQNYPPAQKKKKISKTDIQLVYSHYMQNGDHSAVTGGKGTEKLTIFAPEITVRKRVDSLSNYAINVGVDFISSASTDKIDLIVSSASLHDRRVHLSFSYNTGKKGSSWSWGGTASGSMESDYLSWGLGISAHHIKKDKSREVSIEFESFLDDLRWGRVTGSRPLKLVYPQELRGREWFSQYRRQSFNLNLAWEQTINKKMLLAVFPGLTHQRGLLGTPFHRVYFTDGSVRVENLPFQRWKLPLGIQLNSYLGNRLFLKNFYRFYWDNFGILAHTLESELPIKISPSFTMSPIFRFYHQRGARFFKPYGGHSPLDKYYTSDYDLSRFNSYETGLETRFTGLGKKPETTFNNFGLRYAWYHRNDGLNAHTITLLVDFSGNEIQ